MHSALQAPEPLADIFHRQRRAFGPFKGSTDVLFGHPLATPGVEKRFETKIESVGNVSTHDRMIGAIHIPARCRTVPVHAERYCVAAPLWHLESRTTATRLLSARVGTHRDKSGAVRNMPCARTRSSNCPAGGIGLGGCEKGGWDVPTALLFSETGSST